MPRNVRVQYAGAIQHVYGRGNYRSPIFESPGAARAFEKLIFEAARRYGWGLHAYVIMINHYHLALETPQPNLSAGMHWLLSTFAIRFNRLRKEQGHLFQGRYSAKIVEPGSGYFASLIDYIHLNPVEAGILPAERVADFRCGSLRRLVRGGRPPCLVCEGWLEEMGGLRDTREGWRSYQDRLVWLAAQEGGQKKRAAEIMCRGWALGSKEWKQDIARSRAEQMGEGNFPYGEIPETQEAFWGRKLETLLANAGKAHLDIERDRCGAEWKVAIAEQLRCGTTATNTWIAAALHMGSRNSVSVYLSRYRNAYADPAGVDFPY